MRASRAQIIDYISSRIESLYDKTESRHIARMVAAALSNEDETKYLIEREQIVEIPELESTTDQLAAGRPVQYVIGHSEFCGLEIEVSEGVLIPRPETEELVMWAKEKAKGFGAPSLLDICTGSGCIALALASEIDNAKVTAIDISDQALAIARRNQQRLGLDVTIIKDNALGGLTELTDSKFDIVVSNPPYIPISEREDMHINVTQYEPHIALFVDNEDPLIFYRAIARRALTLLRENGYLMFEVHEKLAHQTAAMLQREGYYQIEIRRDCFDKERMICCSSSQK